MTIVLRQSGLNAPHANTTGTAREALSVDRTNVIMRADWDERAASVFGDKKHYSLCCLCCFSLLMIKKNGTVSHFILWTFPDPSSNATGVGGVQNRSQWVRVRLKMEGRRGGGAGRRGTPHAHPTGSLAGDQALGNTSKNR